MRRKKEFSSLDAESCPKCKNPTRKLASWNQWDLFYCVDCRHDFRRPEVTADPFYEETE